MTVTNADRIHPIDLERYPIDKLTRPAGRRLLAQTTAALDELGCVVLKGFLPPQALAGMAAESRRLSGKAHFKQRYTNPYSSEDDPALPSDHPRRVFMERTNGFVAGDLITPETLTRRLYHDRHLQAFIAACIGKNTIYEYADPLAGLVFNVLKSGCQHPWHFDNNEFIVSLMTQKPQAGGLFEFCPGIRAPGSENFTTVGAVLKGDREPVRVLDLQPGDLQIFYGRHSLHRVTRVQGDVERHTVILAYTEQPGTIADAERTRRLFGRVSEDHLNSTQTVHALQTGSINRVY